MQENGILCILVHICYFFHHGSNLIPIHKKTLPIYGFSNHQSNYWCNISTELNLCSLYSLWICASTKVEFVPRYYVFCLPEGSQIQKDCHKSFCHCNVNKHQKFTWVWRRNKAFWTHSEAYIRILPIISKNYFITRMLLYCT